MEFGDQSTTTVVVVGVGGRRTHTGRIYRKKRALFIFSLLSKLLVHLRCLPGTPDNQKDLPANFKKLIVGSAKAIAAAIAKKKAMLPALKFKACYSWLKKTR
ncbi:hypothetical protein L2E82_41441 [Cichorium intybus]|uniref:Uncharacterized protein n=1 Tax=Cichorium intybus TaxID=13427 RepID=A0ACB9AMK7_CICIN|nr:hypothetical protein L2E82_41441 [Cichorium intybus]